MSIRLLTLGVPACYLDDVKVTELPAQKARFALLVYLAVERSASRDELAALFWPESDDDRARHALSQSLYELKRLLGNGWIRTESGRLVVSDGLTVDTHEFDRLLSDGAAERAVELYHGPFLSGFFLGNSKGFETWVDRQRSVLERAHRRARRECVSQLVESKRWPDAIEVARRWVELDPFEDEANHALIDLLARSGNRTDALREYSAYEKRLREELSIEPLEHTRQLVEAIRRESTQPSTGTSAVIPPPRALDQDATSKPENAAPNGRIDAPAFIRELSRRRVPRMVVWYAATSFAAIQFAQTMQDAFELPSLVLTTTAMIALAGFPIAVILSWHFDLTADGLQRTRSTSAMTSRSVVLLLAVCGFGGVLWFAGIDRGYATWFVPGEQLDTARFAILPFHYAENVSVRLNEDQLLQDAMSGWTGVAVVDLFQVRDALARSGDVRETAEALRVARAVRAGRFIRGEVSLFRDSLRIHAALYDARRNGAPIADRSVRVAVSLQGADSAFAALAKALLFQGEVPRWRTETSYGTRSWVARRAFVAGLHAIQEWELPRADTLLSRAIEADAAYAQARLWLAVVRAWAGREPATWGYLAEQARADSTNLGERDRYLAAALASIAKGTLERACDMFRSLARDGPHDFVAWYGLGDCLIRDDIVIRDSRSVTGWAFRTSWQDALRAFQRAFEMMPSLHAAIRGNAYQQVRRLLFTGRSQMRMGRAPSPDTTTFLAYPMLAADSLAFIPMLASQAISPPSWFSPRLVDDAVQRQRRLFYEIARTWSTAFPESPEAAEAVAIAMQMLGNPGSIDTIGRARSLATDTATRLRIGATEVWFRVRFAIPFDEKELSRGVKLAEEIIATSHKAGGDPAILSIAALLGRPSKVMRLLAARGGQNEIVAGTHLVLLAALDAEPDSLNAAELAFRRAITVGLSTQAAGAARERWLERAAVLLWPRSLPVTVPAESPARKAQVALSAGDTARARTVTESMLAVRRRVSPQDRTIDIVFSDAVLLAALGDRARAAAWLDSTLVALPGSAPDAFYDPIKAVTLARAMLLRADLASQLGDHAAARRWRQVVSLLWMDCEPALRALRDRHRTTVVQTRRR